MAKYVVVGDVLVKGAHKYKVTNIEQVMSADKIVIFYETLKTKVVRSMKVDPSEFVKVEQVDEVAADPVESMDEEQYRNAMINGEIKGDWYAWLRKKLDISRSQFPLDHDMEKEAYRICVENMAEGNAEEGAGYFDNLNDEYGDIERARSKKETSTVMERYEQLRNKNEVAAEVNEVSDDPVKSVNIYIDHCKKEIETIKMLIVDAVDEDEKLFQKGRMKCKREELTFLETRKSEILSKQETVLPADPVMKTPLMAKLIVVGDVISKGRHKYEVTNIKEYGDTITLFYSTIGTKNKIVRFMEVPPTHFITVYENVG